ncbi:MAG TPA: RluA family pseudouridine synthase [Candidatus Magasanikbacteria bacterium]|nr:RluA family pseudouridine synthase [Candidatus Magasanikbacteria bacterium]
MPKLKQFIFKKDSPVRLDVLLAEKLKTSRSQVQKLIENKQISINGIVAKKSGENVIYGNKIEINEIKNLVEPKTSKNTTLVEKKISPNILAVEKDFLIVDKPSGLLTHNTEKENYSLAEFLTKKYPEIKKVGEDSSRPGIIHRLDKEASGLLVVARNQKMFNFLKKQFQERTVDKEYCVLVHGKVSADTGFIDFPLERSKNNERMAAIPKTVRGMENDEGKKSLTEFWVEKKFVNFSLLTVKIHTGRMHQIRAHFLAYDHPVVGDPLYFQKKQKRKWDDELGRLFLHCFKLEFTDLQGNRQKYEIPLPKELTDFLKKLK